MLVSVVVPTRDRRHLLGCTLRSVLGQREVDLELIVVDDGSTMPVELGRDRRLKLVRHASQQGVSAARNTGIEVAGGEWVAFCDDDDVWAPDKLSAQLAAAAEASATWVYAGAVAIDDDLRVLSGAPPLSPAEVVAALARYNAVPGSASSVVVTAQALATVGGFDTRLRRTEDWDLWLRLAQLGAPASVARPLVGIRQHVHNVLVDRASLIEEPELLGRRYGIPIDPLSGRRRAAWGLLRAGRRLSAAREYASLAARGDLKSLGRAAVALVHPSVGTDRMFALAGGAQDLEWARAASAWLTPLARTCAE
jgi:hypothetical protein